MDPLTIGILALVGLIVALLLGVPIGVAMAMCGLGGTAAIIGTKPAIALFGTTVYSSIVTYDLSIIPLFLLMGAIAARTGLSREFYTAFYTWLGGLRGRARARHDLRLRRILRDLRIVGGDRGHHVAGRDPRDAPLWVQR